MTALALINPRVMIGVYMKLFMFVTALTVAITGDLRPWRYSVAEHMKLCHPNTYKGNVMSLTNGTGLFSSSAGTLLYNNKAVDPPSVEMQRRADEAKFCEKSQQDLLELLDK